MLLCVSVCVCVCVCVWGRERTDRRQLFWAWGCSNECWTLAVKAVHIRGCRCPEVSLKKTWFYCHKRSWKLSRVPLKNIQRYPTYKCWNKVLNRGHWLASFLTYSCNSPTIPSTLVIWKSSHRNCKCVLGCFSLVEVFSHLPWYPRCGLQDQVFTICEVWSQIRSHGFSPTFSFASYLYACFCCLQ